MNRTIHGNIAIGAEGSLARAQSNESYLAAELKIAIIALNELRERFVPNNPEFGPIALADKVLARHSRLLSYDPDQYLDALYDFTDDQ